MDNPSFLRCSVHEPYLYEIHDDRIFRCACCGRIQIEFQGRTLLMETEEFETLLDTLAGMRDRVDDTDADEWVLSAPTETGSEAIRLMREEVDTLHDLLAGAQAMRALEERIGAVAVGRCRERPPASWRR